MLRGLPSGRLQESVPIIVIFNGCSNIYSAVSMLFVRVPRTVGQGEQVTVKGILRDSRGALRSIVSDLCLRVLVIGVLIINLLAAGPLSLILPFTVEKGFSIESYGILVSVSTVASLAAVLILGAVKLTPKARYTVMAIGFIVSVGFYSGAYLSNNFVLTCVFAALASFANCIGNTVLNAALMLALPEENRGAILGFIQSASVGGTAVSTLAFGLLGDVFPLYLVFLVGNILSLLPMVYITLHSRIKELILSN